MSQNTTTANYETNSVSVYLHDTFNKLSNLSNKKFIESSMAPTEIPTTTKKPEEKKVELTGEEKLERYKQAVKLSLSSLNITENDDDNMSKSNTMTSVNIFKGSEGLPFIIGSRAFHDDEFMGIIEKNEQVLNYMRGNRGIEVGNAPPDMNGS
mmetsp:Transcript_16238/g.13833  ORF Transcript_16238/g.13833 Transcript_16238/m.13833 type:complete len:153 (+) Transcript_16238:173-631(+)|eukprot:CAMPEP_0114583468 /NCGR_PEP_ID=MMETSP0125-20121206/7182_1 /TAXON_ID=485358 ORGANISM="Aristerostoma sp., Strain ATCC 50986" /NCGR_SAMPLE_ID=MMETSP0125 /ASSEMBLY_ACC=CAM_ASM_000245 /LENGTH=152 /DNA_ID=CAMNT_0001776917 /DNA_START=112 /DNA_END=570 /DNA_ORIENTATION=+